MFPPHLLFLLHFLRKPYQHPCDTEKTCNYSNIYKIHSPLLLKSISKRQIKIVQRRAFCYKDSVKTEDSGTREKEKTLRMVKESLNAQTKPQPFLISLIIQWITRGNSYKGRTINHILTARIKSCLCMIPLIQLGKYSLQYNKQCILLAYIRQPFLRKVVFCLMFVMMNLYRLSLDPIVSIIPISMKFNKYEYDNQNDYKQDGNMFNLCNIFFYSLQAVAPRISRSSHESNRKE